MEITSLVLSIIASAGTIISIVLNFIFKRELDILKQQISGNRNIQSKGNNGLNNTGDGNTFKH